MRLFGKIFAGVLLCFVLLVLALSHLVSAILIAETRAGLIDRHRFMAQHVAKEVAAARRESRWPFESLHSLTQQSEVRFWWVVDAEGRIELANKAEFMGTNATAYFPSLAAAEDSVAFPDERAVGIIRVPLTDRDTMQRLWLGFSTVRLRQAQRRVVLLTVASALVALALLAIASYVVVRHFLRPVEALSEGAAALGAGDLKYRINVPLDDELGKVASAFNRMADELEARHARLNVLFRAIEQADETIVITDDTATIQYVNPAFERITGYSASEAMGRNPRLLQSGRHQSGFYDEMWETLTAGNVWRGRFVNRRKDGSIYHEDAAISPVSDHLTGAIVNYVAVKRDITEEIELEGRLRQRQRMEAIGTLAGGVAHEINNPINGVINYAQLLLDRLPGNCHVTDFAGEIINEGNRIASIVRSLLQFSRKEQASVAPADVSEVVEGALSLFVTTTKRDRIRTDCDISPDLPAVACREQQIQQVLMNLFANARDALNERYPGYHEDKSIRVTVREVATDGGPRVRLTVEDHGTGIPEDVRERLFDPFFTTKSRAERAGLGLAISHGIVRDHGGELTVESELGKFTRFSFDLPVDESCRS